MFTDTIGAYMNAGITERTFKVSYYFDGNAPFPSFEICNLYYQQYYHLESGCRLNITYNGYVDLGVYYGIKKRRHDFNS